MARTTSPIPPDFEELVRDGGFRDPAAARARIGELHTDPAEMIALARVCGLLRGLLRDCPDPDAALLQLARFVEVRGSRLQLYRTFLDHPALLDRFVQVVASSRYLADVLVRTPDHLALLSDAALLARPQEIRLPEGDLDAARRAHRREMLRIGAAELLGLQELEDITRQISDLADAFVARCLEAAGPGRLTVLALGKWGGRELNYSSDIDLVFVARAARDLPAATETARRLLRLLGEPTVEGVVYRTDLRLRPYGAQGALVLSAARFEEYLKTKAYPAERQMMLKARAAAGDLETGRRLLRRIRPLLFRDGPRARADVRQLKARIERQLHEKGQADGHLKLAPGGIRDVEFLAQALQLEARLPGAHTLEALAALEGAGRLDRHDADALREAYVFLRGVEHRMQLMENQQVYRLPRKEEDLLRLARSSGFRGPDADRALLDAYDARARRVRAIFDRALSHRPAEPAKAEALRKLVGPAAERIDPSALDLLDKIRRADDIAVQADPKGGGRWTLSIAAAHRAGLLASLAGLLAARRVDVRSGDVVTVRKPGVGRVVLAVFEVAVPDGIGPEFWEAFRKPPPREALVDEIARSLPAPTGEAEPLPPLRIETREGDGAAELHLRAPDTIGFLFEFAVALDALDLEVQRAVVRTLGDEVYDTFWVTGAADLDRLRVTAALVKQFTHLLPRSPDPAQALRQFTALLHQMSSRPRWVRELRNLESPTVLATIAELMGVSRFLWEDFLLLQHENLFPVVKNVPALDRRRTRAQMARDVAGARDAAALNALRDREMFRIDLRHLTRRSAFPEFMESLSDLAELVIGRAAELLRPRGAWSILALGKFGGRELGLASDLDLVVVYRDERHAERLFEFVRSLVALFPGKREGSFGIDLRLRPHGDSGAWATSLAGFRRYYPAEARPFERLALVRLRPVAGDPALGREILRLRDAFVYSGLPLDLDNLLHLRKRQAAELVPAGETDAKYSAGGLTDLEYFVQTRQIGAGAKDPSLRTPNTLEAVDRLVRAGHLRPALGDGIAASYLFLRRLIDSLRAVRGTAKDSRIPSGPGFAHLARRMGAASPAALEAEIRQRMSFARSLWGA